MIPEESMMEFTDCSGCKDCTLWENAQHPGIATRELSVTGKKRALLVVGDAPGYSEDVKGESWVGKSGDLLEKFIAATELAEYVDVYLTNACRCRPLANDKPTNGQTNKCRQYLLKDYRRLAAMYPEGVIILACGGTACFSVAKHKSITAATREQGQSSTVLTYSKEDNVQESFFLPLAQEQSVTSPSSVAPVCFFTYHPALLFPGRQPGKVYAVESHFILLQRYLAGDYVPDALSVTPLLGTDVPPVKYLNNLSSKIVTVDIETYGILKGIEQTGFCPTKSLEIDKIPYNQQVVTVAFGYKGTQGVMHTPVYRFDRVEDRQKIIEWFRRISYCDLLVVGQNIKFDLLYLAAADKELGYWIDPGRIRIDDTLLASFLLYDLQPEKGLKEMSRLFGIADYSKMKVTGKSGTATGSNDPELHRYNAMDVYVTYQLYEQLWERIKNKYGSHSDKLGDACSKMRNWVLWDAFNLERIGCSFDMLKLAGLHNGLVAERAEVMAESEIAGTVLKGTGSGTAVLELLVAAIDECCLQSDPRVVLTTKKRMISTAKENRQLVKQYLEPGSMLYNKIVLLDRYQKVDKLVSSYTDKLLNNKRDGITKKGYSNSTAGIAYPSWYPVPSPHSNKGGSAETKIGGTVQGRLSCTRPAAQTFPQVVNDCKCTRFLPGKLKSYDLSQIELRMAALYSGDAVLVNAYVTDKDLHSQTAEMLFPDSVGTEDWVRWRSLAKRLNFLVLYKGGAVKFSEVVRAEEGIELEIAFCTECIRKWDANHAGFRTWQNSLIAQVRKTGYLELVTGWSRTFGIGPEPPVNEICNFPLQTTAAQLLQSAEYAIDRELRQRRMKAVVSLQVHDSIEIDMPVVEEAEVDRVVDKYLTRPPLLDILEDKLGRTVPIKYEAKELAINGYARQRQCVS